MPVKIQAPRRALLVRFILNPWGKAFLGLSVVALTLSLVVFTYFWMKYSRVIQAKLDAGPFAATSMLFAAPRSIAVGEPGTPLELAAELRRSGYTESSHNPLGYYTLGAGEIDVYPGPQSYFEPEAGVIKFDKDKVARIVSLRDNTDRTQYLLEPELISNLFDKNREKRRIVHYADIPPVLVHAVISIEDKRFFQHSGFDPIRIIKAAWIDIRERRSAQGASTLSQQLARSFWLDQKKTIRRKLEEMIITLQLEQKLSKQQIFEYYSNQVDLGHRGSFDVRGFGEAAQVYFGKDISRLSLPEAATLAGLIQRPSYFNPYRWPDRATQRRNVVLGLMLDNGYINQAEYQDAVNTALTLSRGGMESTDAPYFTDLVNDTLSDQLSDYNFRTRPYRVYTTLDLQLQHDAAEAVRIGMEEVDKIVQRRRKKDPSYPDAQCALIALDPQTGQIKALIGGRNYGVSQLDHIVAKRQPGSSFKPFVYAAALNTAIDGAAQVITPVSTLNDEPTTFWYDGKPYQPNNFKGEFMGNVTLRTALAHSLNAATVELAQEVGYGTVVDLARRAGMNLEIRPTPAVALGAYEVTPLEIAGAYTIFANHGEYVKPSMLVSVQDEHGGELYHVKPDTRQVLDPRVAFMMVSMLEEVIHSGTAAQVRARGFTLPAAGKTGTSHDGWFAGFTSKLLCIVWVGFDDNRQLDIEGAHSALPVWTEFMKRAHQHREYRDVSQFEPPSGVVGVQVDPETGEVATAACPKVTTEYFIDGTQPVEMCRLHGGGGSMTQVAGWDLPRPAQQQQNGAPPPVTPNRPDRSYASNPSTGRPPSAIQPNRPPDTESAAAQPPEQPRKKKGFFGRIRDIFK
ncbi:MAG TPA: PBP1A family penicillin-binding protein [Bryobacteraceae bacterium]|nr:PBP1A family penicillin-binding protein [Bryobacteraceae bacterium]